MPKRIINYITVAAVIVTLSASINRRGLYVSAEDDKASYSENELNEIYSQILCIKCGMGHVTIDVCQCVMALELRTKVKERLEQGFSPEEVIWNFNGDNIAFMYQLPERVIREVDCPCACGETLEVCIGELRGFVTERGKTQGCPVIYEIIKDIRRWQKSGYSDEQIIDKLKNSEQQTKYEMLISTAIETMKSTKSYDLSMLPDAILDDSECYCACTEGLRTCIEEMPWCDRIEGMIRRVALYLRMGLSSEEAAASMYSPCGKICAKNTTGTYLGINCDGCQRPIRDKAYYAAVNGEDRAYCCESCYQMDQELPDAILDNVKCEVCPCETTLRNCKCANVAVQRMLIKTWLMEGKTSEEIIERFSDDYGR